MPLMTPNFSLSRPHEKGTQERPGEGARGFMNNFPAILLHFAHPG